MSPTVTAVLLSAALSRAARLISIRATRACRGGPERAAQGRADSKEPRSPRGGPGLRSLRSAAQPLDAHRADALLHRLGGGQRLAADHAHAVQVTEPGGFLDRQRGEALGGEAPSDAGRVLPGALALAVDRAGDDEPLGVGAGLGLVLHDHEHLAVADVVAGLGWGGFALLALAGQREQRGDGGGGGALHAAG